jgi:putative phosphoesterase
LRILIVSDIHSNNSAVARVRDKALQERVDVLLICGDITHFGTIQAAESILEELSYSSKVLFVHGNCDPIKLSGIDRIKNAENLHSKLVNIDGLSFIGSGGSLKTPFQTRIEYTEEEISKHLKKASLEIDNKRVIVVSHDPPFNTKLDRIYSGKHVGSKALREFILTKKPMIVSCGHIHEGRGIDKISDSIIINPGPTFNGYCAIVEINENLVIVELSKTD